MAILATNNDKPIPPVYYLLKSKFMEYECAFDETHELTKELDEDDPRLLPSYATDVEATPYVQISSDNVSLPQIISAPCQQTPKENTTLLPVISPAEQCKSSKESRVPLVPVTLFCENIDGKFDEENRFQPPITYPVEIPSIPPMSDSAFKFYNNNVKVSIQQCWESEKETRPQSSSELWFQRRKLRLTASNFGNIIKRKKADVSKLVNRLSTTCDSFSHLKWQRK